MHLVLLAGVLTFGVVLTSPGVPFSSDEGAGIIQARLLERSGSWIEPNPFPRVDPTNAARTVPHADVGTKGQAPYARHPLYPWVLAVADRLFGPSGFLVLGVAGAVAAALGAAMLARRLDERWTVPALWLTGVGSPLVFDSGLVLAHTLAAGLAGAAGLTLLAGVAARGWRALLLAAPLGVLIGLMAALRTEGAILGVALAVAAGLASVAGWPGVSRAGALAAGTASLLAVGMVHFGEVFLLRQHIGQAVTNSAGVAGAVPQSFWRARWHGFLQSWLTAGYHPAALARLMLLAAVVAAAAAGLLTRRGRRPDLVVFLLGLALVAVLGRLAIGDPQAVPGLMVVFPAGWFAIFALRRAELASVPARLLGVTVATFGLGVLATTYPTGGGIEWGGRYFALCLPLAVPLVVAVIANRATELGPVSARLVVGAVGALSVAFALMAWVALDHGHVLTRRALTAVAREARTVGPPSPAVVVTPEQFLPQLDWPHYFDYRWLVPARGQLGDYTTRLSAAGLKGFVLISGDPSYDLPAVVPYRPTDKTQVAEYRVNVPRHPPPITVAAMSVP